jgi:transposase
MIGLLPELHDDELLYSWFANYRYMTNCEYDGTVLRELFGEPRMKVNYAFPNNLDEFIKRSSWFELPPVSSLIKEHTLLNYLSSFKSQRIKDLALSEMISGDSKHAVELLMQSRYRVKPWEFFRYCPMCFQEDDENNRLRYWRRMHQLPKVITCYQHPQELLRDSPFRVSDQSAIHHFYSAMDFRDERRVDYPDKKTLSLLQKFTAYSTKLMTMSIDITSEELALIYKTRLQELGIGFYSGLIRRDKLFQLFSGGPISPLIQYFGLTFEKDSSSDWTGSITVADKVFHLHPVMHIVTMMVLGIDLEDLVILKDKPYQPFGSGPFPCLNPAAEHYQRPVIYNVDIHYDNNKQKDIATFVCDCGFVYSRNRIHGNPFEASQIIQFGSMWEAKVRDLYKQGVKVDEIAKRLECNRKTVYRHLHGVSGSKVHQYRQPHRRANRVNNGHVKRTVDWCERESGYLAHIDECASKIKGREPLVRVTKTALLSELGVAIHGERLSTKMPNLCSKIEVLVEDMTNYRRRKLAHSYNKMNLSRNGRIDISVRMLLKDAKVSYSDLNDELRRYILLLMTGGNDDKKRREAIAV